MAPSLPAESSWSFATTTTSVWTEQPLHIHRPMSKWNGPMA
jgi:hypothetical protein